VGHQVSPQAVVSVSQHYKNPTKHVGQVQSGPHHHLITNHYPTDAVIASIDVCLPFYFSYFTATDLKKKIQQWKNDKRKSKK
jgi:hypothetical protein